MTLKVHLTPHVTQIKDDNGVGRVIHAQYRHLPRLGIELVHNADEADVIACHMQQNDLPRVDVLHVHGLYWTGDPGSGSYESWHHEANRRILAAARQARAITVPSAWVGECFKRDMRITPEVIGHGVDVLPWAYAEKPGEYILWNKNRCGDVCSPTAAEQLARRHKLPVVSTFGTPSETMQTIGLLPHGQMLDCVRKAGVYLATTKETFGIGTLEALANGTPVLGYRWGGTAELIKHQVTGYLVEPGDVDGLAEGYAWLMERRMNLIEPCRESARYHRWDRIMARYANLYHRVAAYRAHEQHRVSVVIPNYNYGQYVGRAIQSAMTQQPSIHEIIVVDDGSTDDSMAVINEWVGANETICKDWQEQTGTPTATTLSLIAQTNQGVAAARNAGITAATGDYIVCLDADDQLAPGYVETCRNALTADRGLGIAYTGLGFLAADGTIGPNVWTQDFDWDKQSTPRTPPLTTIHCAAMFRKDAWLRAGGYQQVYAPGEDAEFWTRILSVGYSAKQVTSAPLFGYRNHDGSASKTKEYRPVDTWHPWMRDKAYPMAAPARVQPLVRSYSEPTVSVIIPVGPDHLGYLPAALDSLLGQSFRNWEVICVLDWRITEYTHQQQLRRIDQVYPFIRWDTTPAHASGPGLARNQGLAMAKAPFVLWLDADDYLTPPALESMLRAYLAGDAGYIYSDWYGRHADGRMEMMEAPDYQQMAWLEQGQHAVTCLMATTGARRLGGFDEDLRGWEDWDFFVKAAIAGVCGVRVPQPLLVYRYHTGTRRDQSLARKDELLAALRDRYAGYALGEEPMGKCCGGNGDAIIQARQYLEGAPVVAEAITPGEDGKVRMEFIGDQQGAVTWVANRNQYRAGREPASRYINAEPQDVKHLESLGVFRVVPGQQLRPPPVAVATPAPVSIPEPPTMDAAPLAMPPEEELSPAEEAALNLRVQQAAAQQRKAERA